MGVFILSVSGGMMGAEPYTEVWGRITPLAGAKKELLLEVPHRRGSWSEVARGQAVKFGKIIAGDTKERFHGPGSLEASLRRLAEGQERLPMELDENGRFVYVDTGEGCSVQEALFHFFGLPIEIGGGRLTLNVSSAPIPNLGQPEAK